MSSKVKTVLVTGAAGGIGRAACERLARGGWNVLAVDLDAAKLAWTDGAEGIQACAADVTTEADNTRMVAEAVARFGGLDAVVLNAGTSVSGRIEDVPYEVFQKVVAINLFGPVLGIRAALPALRRGTDPAILVTSSTMGLAADAESSAYAASKHGVIGLVKSLSREIGWEGIRINALCPGPTRATGMTGIVETAAPAHYDLMARSVPLQRWAEPDEMAAVIEFLISPAASYVNGHAMVADGGTIAGTGLLPPSAGAQQAIPDALTGGDA